MEYLGLVPGEDSRGEKHRRGRITRTGNALVRRLLVETGGTTNIAERWDRPHATTQGTIGASDWNCRQGAAALCRRFRKLAAEHKPAPKIAVAIPRELAGFLWATLQPVPVPVE